MVFFLMALLLLPQVDIKFMDWNQDEEHPAIQFLQKFSTETATHDALVPLYDVMHGYFDYCFENNSFVELLPHCEIVAQSFLINLIIEKKFQHSYMSKLSEIAYDKLTDYMGDPNEETHKVFKDSCILLGASDDKDRYLFDKLYMITNVFCSLVVGVKTPQFVTMASKVGGEFNDNYLWWVQEAEFALDDMHSFRTFAEISPKYKLNEYKM